MSGDAAGYSGKPLWQKLGLTPGLRARVIDAPRDYATLTAFDLASLAMADEREPLDFVHLFACDTATLQRTLPACIARLGERGMCWVSWPKQRSALHRDLTEDGVRAVALPLGWVDVKVCAVDADWSALKLLRRRR